MDKPEWCSAEVWQKADEVLPEINTDGYGGIALTEAHIAIAKAILSAQSQAYIDAARIAENYRANMAFWLGKDWQIANASAEQSAQDISAAILQRKEEMGR